MQQYGQSVTDEKNIEQTVARVMSNKDEVKRLTEQLSGERILNFFKENISYKSKKLTYDQFIKDAYQVKLFVIFIIISFFIKKYENYKI